MQRSSRRRRQTPSRRERAEKAAQELKQHEWFRPFGERLAAFLAQTRETVVDRGDDPAGLVLHLAERLSTEPDRYAKFDKLLTDGLFGEVSNNTAQLSPIIVPCYAVTDAWGYEARQIPEGQGLRDIGFVFFKRRQQEVPELDDYVWLIHELFHHVMYPARTLFKEFYAPTLEKIILEQELSALANRGLAKIKSSEARAQLKNVWALEGHYNWPVELAIDGLCLWTLGPAYLDAFLEAHDNEGINPFQIEQSHPPIELRTSVLLSMAAKLGWDPQAADLRQLQGQWQKDRLAPDMRNYYEMLRNKQLMNGCIDATMKLAESLGLEKVESEDLRRLEQAVASGTSLYGSDLAIAARLFTKNMADDALLAWEERMIAATLGELESDS